MKIKGYWLVTAVDMYDTTVKEIVKARTPAKAVIEFYKKDDNWHLKKSHKVKSVSLLEVEVINNATKEIV